MRLCQFVIAVGSAVSIVGCRPAVDMSAEQSALERTDRDWAAVASAGTNVDSIVSYWADDARIYPVGMPLVSGKTAIREFVVASLKMPGFSITWTPEHVEISPDGKLGYTTGANRVTAPDSTGKVVPTLGRYVTVWRKTSEGKWKCVIDTWNAGPAT